MALPKGVWFQRKRLADGSVIRYGYYGRGAGSIALGREGTPAFFDAIAAAVRKEPAQGTVRKLIWRYKTSPEFARLKPRTRADYVKLLDKIDGTFCALSLRAMSAREMAGHIYRWRDGMSQSPRRADYAVQVLKALLSWAHTRGLIEHNRALGIERLYRTDRRERTWSEKQVSAFLAVAQEPMRRAMVLALETGQRQGDLLTLAWSSVGEHTIRLRQKKTGAQVSVPISKALRACLDQLERKSGGLVLTKADGKPWDPNGNGFRSAWRDAVHAAGVTGVTFHDLRGTFVTRRLSEGWTTLEVSMCTGHSLRDSVSLERYADRETVADANAQRLAKRVTSTG